MIVMNTEHLKLRLSDQGSVEAAALSDVDWRSLAYEDAKFADCLFQDAQFSDTVFAGAKFVLCQFIRCCFSRSDLHEAAFDECVFVDRKWNDTKGCVFAFRGHAIERAEKHGSRHEAGTRGGTGSKTCASAQPSAEHCCRQRAFPEPFLRVVASMVPEDL